jgi:hypothetical protein
MEFRYVEMPQKGLTGSKERQAAVNSELRVWTSDGWEPVSIADTGATGMVGFLLKRG